MWSTTFATARSSISGPRSTPSSKPLPTRSAATAAVNRSTNASWTPSCTRIRFAQTQVWPALRNFEAIAPTTAASTSASSKTMNGALPPSSSETRLTVSDACRMSSLPTGVDPVNVILRTSGEVASSPPTSSAGPQTTLSTPAGSPARRASSPIASADSGVEGAGLTTIVQPAASAGAALRAIIAIGKFHGVIAAHTPIGLRSVSSRRPSAGDGMTSPYARLASSAYHSTKVAP